MELLNMEDNRYSLENVNNPQHYNEGTIECIKAIAAALSPEEFKGFLKGNIFKYIWREEHKNGLVDLKKAQWYLERLIDISEP
jgi:hypothetical protein